jgi:hypothetical protein
MGMISTDEFRKHLLGYNVIDCQVRRNDFYYLVAREDYTQRFTWKDNDEPPDEIALKKRVIPIQLNKPAGQQWSSAWLSGFEIVESGITFEPIEQFVAMSITGQVFSVGSGSAGNETKVPYSADGRRSTIFKLRTIGKKLYAAGWDRTVGVREDKDTWRWLSDQIPFNEATEENKCGFRDIDGFNENAIYGAGDNGDVWHFDSKSWRKCAFPSNITLNTVCCAPDGSVYVSGYEGETYRGNGDTWKRIATPELSLPFKDMVWYEDRVWCTSDYGVWWIEGDKLNEAKISSDIKVCAGNLSARDGVLLLAGYSGAAILESGQWKVIFHYNTMAEKAPRGNQ